MCMLCVPICFSCFMYFETGSNHVLGWLWTNCDLPASASQGLMSPFYFCSSQNVKILFLLISEVWNLNPKIQTEGRSCPQSSTHHKWRMLCEEEEEKKTWKQNLTTRVNPQGNRNKSWVFIHRKRLKKSCDFSTGEGGLCSLGFL